jgi:hypothetical protein
MAILGDATTVATVVSRSTSNALRLKLTGIGGAELAHAQQKGGAAVLLGFKNGGKSTYTLTGVGGQELVINVAGTTTVSAAGSTLGVIVPADGGAQIRNGAGTVLAGVRPHTGAKADNAWQHPIVNGSGQQIGDLTLMRSQIGWRDIESDVIGLLFDQNYASLKAPSAGTMLTLTAPVPSELGDLLAAACVDFSVLPRGYIA